MPRTIKKCFSENLTFEKMLEAHERAKCGKLSRSEVLNFELCLEINIVNLIRKIESDRYRIGPYREFKVYEPKERMIKALPYVDRIVHQWYVEEFIKKYITPKFIKDTYACITDRGTHKAVSTTQHYLRLAKKHYGDKYYVLKMDIKKFFYSINHSIMLKIMKKHISDKKLLDFTKILIFSDGDGVGIPIGNYTSQFFANIYLSELDYYIKHKLKVKYYVRYMDDFILLVKNKTEAKKVYGLIEDFLYKNLKLSLNCKSRYYPIRIGVDFCGYKIWSTHRLIRKRSKEKFQRKIRCWNTLYKEGKLDHKDFVLSFNSWLGHVKHANSYKLVNKMKSKCKFLNSQYDSYYFYR